MASFSCGTRAGSALVTCSQSTRLRERSTGSPGARLKLEAIIQNSSPTRIASGSGQSASRTGFERCSTGTPELGAAPGTRETVNRFLRAWSHTVPATSRKGKRRAAGCRRSWAAAPRPDRDMSAACTDSAFTEEDRALLGRESPRGVDRDWVRVQTVANARNRFMRKRFPARLSMRSRGSSMVADPEIDTRPDATVGDRKSTRLNSSHVAISYAVFCLKKKK